MRSPLSKYISPYLSCPQEQSRRLDIEIKRLLCTGRFKNRQVLNLERKLWAFGDALGSSSQKRPTPFLFPTEQLKKNVK